MLAHSLSLSAGYSGLISLSHAGFYGLGAYTSAILSVNYQMPFLFSTIVAMLICGFTAIVISSVSLRIVDDYFIIVTLAIQIVIFSILNNWQSLTRGALGISGIPSIEISGIIFDKKIHYLGLSIILAAIMWYLLKNVSNSPFGRLLIAIDEDEVFTKSLGKNVYKAKIISFTVSAMAAAIPGVVYAHYISYIDPTSFTIDESIFILSIVIIGGMRDMLRIALSTAFLVLLPEVLRFVGIPSGAAANLRQILYGGILVFVVFKTNENK